MSNNTEEPLVVEQTATEEKPFVPLPREAFKLRSNRLTDWVANKEGDHHSNSLLSGTVYMVTQPVVDLANCGWELCKAIGQAVKEHANTPRPPGSGGCAR